MGGNSLRATRCEERPWRVTGSASLGPTNSDVISMTPRASAATSAARLCRSSWPCMHVITSYNSPRNIHRHSYR